MNKLTLELLKQANALRNRIRDVNKILEQLDLTDPSNTDTTTRISPIVLHAGMASTIQFDVLPSDAGIQITEMQRIDARMHEYIVKMLKDYKQTLEEQFINLR